jgi:GT2 family glycosyltransferase/tetratricopeptide (TPR) repeat protein
LEAIPKEDDTMGQRYLFGPVTREFAEQNLTRQRASGECIAFNADGSADLGIRAEDRWEDVCARLPAGWRPDFVALYLPYTSIPACLWSAPVPVVVLAADWNLLWHGYRGCLASCDLVLTDAVGVETMERAGIAHARQAILFGCERRLVEEAWPERERDIDVLFVGNVNPVVQRERLAWLGRLARLADRRRVVIQMGVYGAEYREVLARARIVFNRAIRGECNKRVFEAAAAGALLFQEAGNHEVPDILRDRQECVYYGEDDLEELLDHYLENEDERRRIAEAGRALVERYTFEAIWEGQVARIEEDWPALVQRARRRSDGLGPMARVWQALGAEQQGDTRLVNDLAAALVKEPDSAILHNALGVALTVAESGARPIGAVQAAKALGYFQRALMHDPRDPVAGLNCTEALAKAGREDEAIAHARKTLAWLDERGDLTLSLRDSALFPPGFGILRVEWERAAWANAGRPGAEARAKRDLVRWRLHALLGELTASPAHAYEVAVARPDLPTTRAALGCALARAGQIGEAVPHLRFAVDANPFDREAARALFEALGAAGDGMGQRRLADERRLLAEAAPGVLGNERGYAKVPPAGDELASIIVLCCNQVEYTRLCLESVLRHTRWLYELVIVDNGSMDGTGAYLEELRAREGPARVVIIRNEENVGFAAGCNQALSRARGRYLVFLNNDAVVTPGWLEGLVGWAVHDWPNVGLVGPVSNYAPPPQLAEPGYRELAGLDAFAGRCRQEHAGRALRVERLTGFCLLMRREVLRRVGAFDERYGHGFFEDDDLCVRAREAGFGLLVAQDVYVHHFGSTTFKALGIDGPGQLRKNFEQFKAKWGEERSAGYQVPEERVEDGVVGWHALSGAQRSEGRVVGRGESDPAPRPSLRSERATRKGQCESAEEEVGVSALASRASSAGASPSRSRAHCNDADHAPKVSLCMIVKNEEHNLPECLTSIEGLVDEVVVVDTGSTDRTREVAERLGARVFEFPWVDDFASARNESLRHATGDWVFWMDADDRLTADSRERLRALFAGLDGENAAYAMKCRCVPDRETGVATTVDHVRVFRNRPDVRWRYRVHEQILPAVRATGAEVRSADVVIEHVGYTDPALRAKKQERDLRLLELDRQANPDDPFTLFNVGWAYEDLGRVAEALPILRRSLDMSHPGDSIVRKLYTLIVECHRKLAQPVEALAACREGRRLYPEDAQLLFLESVLLNEQGDVAGAEACLLRLVSGCEGPHFASAAEGLRGHLARHNLAVMYQEQDRDAEAEAQWKAVIAEQPAYGPGWLGLGDMYLRQERWADLDELLGEAEMVRGLAVSARVGLTVLRARAHLARAEYAPAKRLVEDALASHPDDMALWVVLSHALLQEGVDWDWAELALRRVLELDPDNGEARSNLAVLERQMAKADQREAP